MKSKPRNLLTFGKVLLFLALLALPTLVRAAYYYRRVYVPQSIPRPDHTAIDVPALEPVAFADEDARPGSGRIIIDRAHDNTVQDAELNVLQARFTARGMETVSLTPGDDLSGMLHDAAGLVVIAPHQAFFPWEIEAVQKFVEKGGLLLLVADPSRYSFRVEYDDYYGEYSVPESDVTAINSLASPFGLAFADDYIYNTAEHAGNYQYVILDDFAPHPLTGGLKEIVFFAAHSISAGQEALAIADDHTTSSLSEQTGGLATMSLGGDGRVLAVSDFTFMTEPYNSSADNNRLIANIADFLAGAERIYTLADFPHFFGDEVDLVSLMGLGVDDAYAVGAIEQGHNLQSAFELADKTLRWRSEPRPGRDTIFVGLYGGVDFATEAGQILARQGISFTLETIEQERATATPTPRSIPTPTSTLLATPPSTPTPEPLHDWISIAGMGRIDVKELALIYHNKEDGRQVLMVLAFAEDGLNAAIQRLIFGDFSRCLVEDDRNGDPQAISLALCPTAYEPSEEGPVSEMTPTPTPTLVDELYATPTPAAEGGILIVADDDGTGTYDWWTSAYTFQDIATQVGYPATVWSTFLDGEVTLEQMQSYDAVIWCTGDYQQDGMIPSEDDLFNIAEYLTGGGRLILTGAFIGSDQEREPGLLLDLQVAQADHPLAKGFDDGQVIMLERLSADEDYATLVLDDTDPETVIFDRGPASEFAGAPLITVDKDELFGSRMIVIGFPLFLMPWEEQTQFGTNALIWMMEDL